jgi:hypothetical protein
VILISDGYSDVLEGSSSSANAGSALKLSGVNIYTIGLGDAPNILELNELATSPSSVNAFILAGSKDTDITTTANAVTTQLCS